MASEIVGVKLQVEGGGEVQKTVGELRQEFAAAVNSAKQIGEQFGKNSKEFADAQANVNKVSASLKQASADAAKFGDGLDKPMKSFRAQLKEAKEYLIQMQEKFGETSQEALAAARSVATISDRIADANEVAGLFDPGKTFQSVVGVGQAIASGFAAAQGAMALFGNESKEVEQALLKVQAAMALAQGLSGAKDSLKDFQRLGALIKTTTLYQTAYNFVMKGTVVAQQQNAVATAENAAALEANTTATVATTVATGAATTALRLFRLALITTGIGAVIVLIGTLIASIQDWSSESQTAEERQGKLTEALEKEIDIIGKVIDSNEKLRNSRSAKDNFGTAGVDVLQRELALLKARGASAKEIYDKEQAIREAERNNLRIQGKTWESYYETLRAGGLLTAKVQKELIDKINDINKSGKDKTNEIEAQKTAFAKEEQAKRDAAAMAALKREETAAMDKAKLANATAAELYAVEDKYAKRREGLLALAYAHDKNNAAAREALQNEIAANKSKRDQREAENNKEILALQNQIDDELFTAHHTAQEKELRDLSFKFEDRIRQYEKAGRDTAELVTAWAIEEADIQLKYDKEAGQKKLDQEAQQRQQEAEQQQAAARSQIEDFSLIAGNEKIGFDIRRNILAAFYADALASAEENGISTAEIDAKYAEARKQIATAERDHRIAVAQQTSTAISGFAALAGEGTAAGKALAIAAATIATYASAQQAYWAAFNPVPNAASPVLGALYAAGAIATGLANIRKIAAVDVPGSSGSTGSIGSFGGTAPLSPQAQSQSVTLDQQSINNMGNAAIKTYVLESDITDTQRRITRIQQAASFK